MDSLGFTVEEKHSVFCIVSGIIQLGNISFSAALIKGSDGGAPLSHYSRIVELRAYCTLPPKFLCHHYGRVTGTADGSIIDDTNAGLLVIQTLHPLHH